jgi:chorismate synthase
MLYLNNIKTKSGDYSNLWDQPSSGACLILRVKKNLVDTTTLEGGGHFSGRITLGLVAAGVIAKKIIAPATVSATLIEAGGSADIQKAVKEAVEQKDSIGGIIECICTGISTGLGEPFFDSVESTYCSYDICSSSRPTKGLNSEVDLHRLA